MAQIAARRSVAAKGDSSRDPFLPRMGEGVRSHLQPFQRIFRFKVVRPPLHHRAPFLTQVFICIRLRSDVLTEIESHCFQNL